MKSQATHICSCCDHPIEPIFKATRLHKDWLYRVCDTCIEECCSNCSEEDEENGTIICSDCYQQSLIQRGVRG